MESRNDEIRRLYLDAGKCLERGDEEGALKTFKTLLALLPEDALHARAILFNQIGHARIGLHDYEEALPAFRRAADLFRRMGERIGLGEQMGNIGSVYRDREDWENSLHAYFQALEIFVAEKHEKGVADQYSNIAYAFARQGKTEQAIRYFDKAKNLYDKIGDTEKSDLCGKNLRTIRRLTGGLESNEGS